MDLSSAWDALERHHDEIADKQLREFFAEDPGPGHRPDADRR